MYVSRVQKKQRLEKDLQSTKCIKFPTKNATGFCKAVVLHM